MKNLTALKLSDFDYPLPKKLIAQSALPERANARFMGLDRSSQKIQHRQFRDVEYLLEKGDVLVLNDTKVIPARLFAKRKTGGRVEILVLKKICHPERSEGSQPKCRQGLNPAYFRDSSATPQNDSHDDVWQALIKPSGRIKKGEELILENAGGISIHVIDEPDHQTGIRHIHFAGKENIESILEQYGHIPLPPYIDRLDSEIDRELYQTVFAKKPGAVASPTAGLHFDEALLQKMEARGVEILCVTLHVSYGTFQPVSTEDLTQHKMYPEYVYISDETAERINFAKSDGRRVIACGTTVVRALESSATNSVPAEVKANEGMTDLFIYPSYEFKIVDGMITNFHLPKTTLLMLVSAFAGHEFLMGAYQEAIQNQYRFYSYGDAMLII